MARIEEQLRAKGMSEGESRAKAALIARCEEAVKGARARVFVPGRIEVLGKHTDYAGGRSLVCAIERGICMVGGPRDDARVTVTDVVKGEAVEFDISPELRPTEGTWGNYPMTVARRVARNFPGKLRGADIAFASDLPPAAGLSSSSALMIAVFEAIDAANDLRPRKEYRENIKSNEELAGYLGTVENGQTFGSLIGDRGVGTFGGSQDHTAILCAKAGMLSQYSFCPVRHERDVKMPGGYVFAVGVSGVVAEKTREAKELYNRVSLCVREIVALWNERTRRGDATLAAAVKSMPGATERMRTMLNNVPQLSDRFQQFLRESEGIIPAMGDALTREDLGGAGELVDESQMLAEKKLKNQVPETIALARIARKCGAIAASAFGAGFGGSVWAMVKSDGAEAFLAKWKNLYLEQYPQRASAASFFTTVPGPAAMRMERR